MLVNGKESTQVAAADRGFQYGDGLFETIKVKNAKPVFLDLHLDRLQFGCKQLGIQFPEKELLSREALRICAGSKSAVLKIIVTRGPGGRGYRTLAGHQPTRVLSLHPQPNDAENFRVRGIRVILCKNRLGINPALAGLKHLNRLEQILARSEWDDATIQEGLMLDGDRNVVEGTMSNLFLVKEKCLITPDLERCGVRGIIRDLILDLAGQLGLETRIVQVSTNDLHGADEVFVTNSVIGIWPVIRCQQIQLKIGRVTQDLIACLDRKETSWCDND